MNPTQIQIKQAEQRDKFLALLADFLSKAEDIDSDTPGDGQAGPQWWYDMSSLQREARRIHDEHTA